MWGRREGSWSGDWPRVWPPRKTPHSQSASCLKAMRRDHEKCRVDGQEMSRTVVTRLQHSVTKEVLCLQHFSSRTTHEDGTRGPAAASEDHGHLAWAPSLLLEGPALRGTREETHRRRLNAPAGLCPAATKPGTAVQPEVTKRPCPLLRVHTINGPVSQCESVLCGWCLCKGESPPREEKKKPGPGRLTSAAGAPRGTRRPRRSHRRASPTPRPSDPRPVTRSSARTRKPGRARLREPTGTPHGASGALRLVLPTPVDPPFRGDPTPRTKV